MFEFQSKKWHFFLASPTSLLKREFVKLCYLYLDSVSSMKISQLLIIGEKDSNLMYIKENEDKRNHLLAKKYLEQKKLGRIFFNFKKFIVQYQNRQKDPIKRVIKTWQELCPVLLYTYYTERALTEKYQKLKNLKSREKQWVGKLLEENGELRERIAKIGYSQYNKIHPYLVKKYKSFGEVDYYLMAELSAGKKIKPADLEKRKIFFVALATKNKTQLYSGNAAKRFLTKQGFKKIKIDKKIKELKGIAAYPGEVSGRVVLIKKIADFKKGVEGKILVSPRTIIEYTPYLKKVKAIIADCGGINSHAAIIAREFKIPCVVGTKIASHIFEDGDFAEVDANKGIVKKYDKRS